MTIPDDTQDWTDPDVASRRFYVSLVISAAAIAIIGLVFATARMSAGIVLGGGLALLNFRWLAASVRGVMAVGSAKIPPGTAMKLALRWLVVGAIGYGAYRTGYFAATGIVIGLLAPAPAVLIESIYLTFKTVRGRTA